MSGSHIPKLQDPVGAGGERRDSRQAKRPPHYAAWPSKLRISRPLAMSHNLTVLSEAAESAILLSGENFTD